MDQDGAVSEVSHQGDGADVLEVIRRHARAIVLALGVVDLANPAAAPVTGRMRGTIEVLTYDISELTYFMPKRPET